MEKGKCPICNETLMRLERYPRSICATCASKENLKDASGNPVDYINLHIGGGFASLHTMEDGTIVQKEDHICFVKGVKCYADEARFGGIVIQVYVNRRSHKAY